jgi:hypothetical protein
MTTNRFFLIADDIYEQVRKQLDVLWGHPSNGTKTCIPPPEQAIRNSNGVIVCPVLKETCEWEEVSLILSQLLDDGTITETDETEYMAAQPTPTEP